MMLIGVDSHKSSHTATAVDPGTNTDLGTIRIVASSAGYRRLRDAGWCRRPRSRGNLRQRLVHHGRHVGENGHAEHIPVVEFDVVGALDAGWRIVPTAVSWTLSPTAASHIRKA
ncbi:hypothetical protein QX204_21205 [Nocardia sp. PE-7]|uniref:hypothetical protein n=1 Tax=Nocardia sp. PE-7 TaxID=3058426 RepID=UPI00265B109F|nr:hypothetical protein [Nocardia sp. PE-7]WKG13533.1 hypothetical protein QX204_21205 [Nocardia sp. PE-7]